MPAMSAFQARDVLWVPLESGKRPNAPLDSITTVLHRERPFKRLRQDDRGSYIYPGPARSCLEPLPFQSLYWSPVVLSYLRQ